MGGTAGITEAARLSMVPWLPAPEATRLRLCVDRLLPHVRLNAIALTGGVAMQVGLAARAQEARRDRVADLDFVVSTHDAVGPSIAGPFLVSHYHVARPGVPKFMLQLVDPMSRLRIDFFPDLAGSIADAQMTAIGGDRIPVLPLERIFEHKLLTLSRASTAAPIDPKHMHDAQVLGAALRRPVPSVAVESVVPDVYGVDDGNCNRCELSRDADWPLAPQGADLRAAWVDVPTQCSLAAADAPLVSHSTKTESSPYRISRR